MVKPTKPDMAMMKADALRMKDVAKQSMAASKLEAAEAKLLRANPVPKYVTLPDGDSEGIEGDSKADLTALQEGFRKRAADEGRRMALATDSEFWAAVCFQSKEQRDTFFAALKVLDIGIGGRYFDGCAIAERLGIALPSADVPYKASSKPDPVWIEFTKG